jgi:hypothetical protein
MCTTCIRNASAPTTLCLVHMGSGVGLLLWEVLVAHSLYTYGTTVLRSHDPQHILSASEATKEPRNTVKFQ